MSKLAGLPGTLNPFILNRAVTPTDGLVDRVNDLRQRYEKHLAMEITVGDFDSRFFKALLFLVPFLDAHLGAERTSALEIGCGRGAKSFPLSLLFDNYYGFDIGRGAIEFAQRAQRRLGIVNTHFVVEEAANLSGFLESTRETFDVIILYAILEHLTIREKLDLLQLCWSHLDDGGILLIGEAPNRMFPIDYHSTKSLYFQQMPLPLWPEYLHRVTNKKWATILQRAVEEGNLELKAFRHGLHVGHQEFDLALGRVEDLNRHIIADNFAVEMLNLYPYESIEYLKYVELLGLRAFPPGVGLEARAFPHFFSRYYLEVLMKKGGRDVCTAALSVEYDGYGEGMTLAERLETPRWIRNGEELRLDCDVPGIGTEGKVSTILGFRDPARSGGIRVMNGGGRVVYEGNVRELSGGIARWRRNIALRLPDLMVSAFPLSVKAVGGAGVSLRYSVMRAVG